MYENNLGRKNAYNNSINDPHLLEIRRATGVVFTVTLGKDGKYQTDFQTEEQN